MEINAYLTFPGTCGEAIEFYKKSLGATLKTINYYKGSPMESQVPMDWAQKIMHASIMIGSSELKLADGEPGIPPNGVPGFSLTINVASEAEGANVFTALSEGAKVTMPYEQQFWGAHFGMLTDKFAVSWMVHCDLSKE